MFHCAVAAYYTSYSKWLHESLSAGELHFHNQWVVCLISQLLGLLMYSSAKDPLELRVTGETMRRQHLPHYQKFLTSTELVHCATCKREHFK